MRHEGQNIFFISDLHVAHANVIRFDGRPFKDTDEMHAEMIKRWNSVVGDDDIVYFLGDLSFGGSSITKWFAYSLKGKIYAIAGNHDRPSNLRTLGRFEEVYDYGTEIGVKDESSLESRGSQGYQKIVMSHYPILSWNKAHYGAWHLHGHCHGGLLKGMPDYYKRKVMDVGCNMIDYTPISYGQVKAIMDKRVISKVDQHGEK
jgi:calcineurin-like phosphoesterase family protein